MLVRNALESISEGWSWWWTEAVGSKKMHLIDWEKSPYPNVGVAKRCVRDSAELRRLGSGRVGPGGDASQSSRKKGKESKTSQWSLEEFTGNPAIMYMLMKTNVVSPQIGPLKARKAKRHVRFAFFTPLETGRPVTGSSTFIPEGKSKPVGLVKRDDSGLQRFQVLQRHPATSRSRIGYCRIPSFL